jgi:hypothetical protein
VWPFAFSKSSVEIGGLQHPPETSSLPAMHPLATCKIALLAGILLTAVSHAEELVEVIGRNVRQMHHKDGSISELTRSPDGKTITKKTRSANGVITMITLYKLDSSGNPLGCKIRDGMNQELFKVSYGYHKVTGLLVEELMFDSRVKRINKDTGKEMPVQRLAYLYDAEGSRSAPIVLNYLPGPKFEDIFHMKSTALESNPFK